MKTSLRILITSNGNVQSIPCKKPERFEIRTPALQDSRRGPNKKFKPQTFWMRDVMHQSTFPYSIRTKMVPPDRGLGFDTREPFSRNYALTTTRVVAM
ncbi:hypothetical protein E2C01_056438 [Portunus trituberculatus]|uniref:Uncharacterized protein n=1 Tax=Portunus trituberculatus TaxID=210409 RepID=A0A5B7H0I9_PORTR|nr:hypothetical protein [Portunus trituberculatus]